MSSRKSTLSTALVQRRCVYCASSTSTLDHAAALRRGNAPSCAGSPRPSARMERDGKTNRRTHRHKPQRAAKLRRSKCADTVTHLIEVGPDPLCNNWQHGDCRGSDQEQEQENKVDFNSRPKKFLIVGCVWGICLCRCLKRWLIFSSLFFLIFSVVQKAGQGNDVRWRVTSTSRDVCAVLGLEIFRPPQRRNPAAAKRGRAPRQK